MSDVDKNIPTLDEVIFYGSSQDNPSSTQEVSQPELTTAEKKPVQRPSFEKKINLLIDEILQKHLEVARKEISQAVMAELKIRANSSRDKPSK